MLLQLGLKTDVTNKYGRYVAFLPLALTPLRNDRTPGSFLSPLLLPLSAIKSLDNFKGCCRLLDTYSNEISEACPDLLWAGMPLSYLESMIDLLVTKHNVNDYLYSPVQIIAQAILWSYRRGTYAARDYHFGKMLIRKLIDLGASVHHRGSNYNDRSIFNWMMTIPVHDPFESMFFGSFWLDALSDAGVDILEYMHTEIALSDKTPFFYAGERCKVLLYTPKKPLEVYWDWYYDPKGPAFDVLEEFKYFELQDPRWKGSPEIDWPFSFPWYWSYEDDERFKRRQRKKAAKHVRAQGFRGKELRMPGAWVH
jgi:hypothetical protein